MNKKHSKSTFKDEWLLNPKYKSWLNNISSNTVRCSFCNKHIDVLSMGVSALESHSNGEKHKQILADRSKNYIIFLVSLLLHQLMLKSLLKIHHPKIHVKILVF